MKPIKSKVQPLIWQDSKLLVLDQRLLPYEKKYLELTTYKEIIDAIKNMVVRGAPLIGITAAYGMALAARDVKAIHELPQIANEIKQSRPTAINLKWAVDLILSDLRHCEEQSDEAISKRYKIASSALEEPPCNDVESIVTKRAIWIHEDDAERCQKIGENGLGVIARKGFSPDEAISQVSQRSQGREIASGLSDSRNDIRVLTICNTGSLATGGIGTAFGVILTAHQKGLKIKVFASETRPRQQGARLTTFECVENGIDCTLISDTACGYLMQKGEIDLVIAGADRIASNGDTANKIGTYQLAILAREHNIPFYIAAPLSTFDLSISSGDDIPIEERNPEEVTNINGKTICAPGVKVRNPAFDVTPAKYITGIITEKGILSGDYKKTISNAFNETVTA